MEEKPRRNLPAIAAMALLVMYVGSYFVIRAHSARLTLKYYGITSTEIQFGISPAELPAVWTSSTTWGRKIQDRSAFLNKLYLPLRKVDRWIAACLAPPPPGTRGRPLPP